MSPAASLLPLAVSFAARAHRGQTRKDGITPYFAHCVRVAFNIEHVFGCHEDDVLCAALLHDTIEDTTTDFDDIATHFGTGVARMVGSLSKDPRLPAAEREDAFFAHLASCDWKLRLVKLADACDNLVDSETARVSTRARAKAERVLALGFGDEPAIVRARERLAALLSEAG